MKNAVIIKSFQNGISVIMDETTEYSELLNEVALKFSESNKFFKDAKMVLSLEGRKLSDKEERQIVDVISKSSDINIVCLVGKDEEKNQMYLRALKQIEQKTDENPGQFYKGTLKNGQTLETEHSIIILGDVYPGSAVISTNDIIVLGGLYGEAYAGGSGEEGHYIVALEMSPEKMKIGDTRYKSGEKQSKWSIKPKIQPKIAYVKNNKLVIDSITKELLNEIPF